MGTASLSCHLLPGREAAHESSRFNCSASDSRSGDLNKARNTLFDIAVGESAQGLQYPMPYMQSQKSVKQQPEKDFPIIADSLVKHVAEDVQQASKGQCFRFVAAPEDTASFKTRTVSLTQQQRSHTIAAAKTHAPLSHTAHGPTQLARRNHAKRPVVLV